MAVPTSPTGVRLLGRAIDQARLHRSEWIRPGESGLSGESLWRVGQVIVATVIVLTNLVGAVIVVVIGSFVVPTPSVGDVGHLRLVNLIVAAAYVAAAVPVGVLIGTRGLVQLRRWLVEERPATATEQRIVLRAPLRLFVLQVTLWAGAAVLFGTLNATYSVGLGLRVAPLVALTGISTAACAYLLTERILRSPAARALTRETPEQLAVPGVAARALLAWALGTGVPVSGLVAIGVLQLAGAQASTTGLAVAIVVLGGIALTVGLLAVGLAARATADPVDSVRRALAGVQRGDFEMRVAVYDGTQLGQLQLGFNRMVDGLSERERIRHLFGTYVDPDVAERILQEGTSLEGEDVEVTIVFVDIRDFTGFAERRSAHEVVASINGLFDAVVPIIHAHGGRVDKFVGDGLLAVFGAPRRQPDHADQALAAALEIRDAVRDGELQIGIGLNSGSVVAGNIGSADRLEFGVIGDVVNTAARVEEATRHTGDTILVAEPTMRLLEASPIALDERPDMTLKGKTGTVVLYAPTQSQADGKARNAQVQSESSTRAER
ncbi:MAG TPA: adenylate/guanylate cyclase domain-containing protein [Acidimicrobiales bacterium]|nr:adenylate/guanylate cyclase domain-containing protein [Acidimicrobiales bacterium]